MTKKKNVLDEIGKRIREAVEEIERLFNPQQQPEPVRIPVPVRPRPPMQRPPEDRF